MSIQIKNISVKDLGPLPPLKHELGCLNLVYGDNEAGKSYLVEFLIRSLFKSKKWSNLRNELGTGKVIVSGLGKKDFEFSPTKKITLEDKLTEQKEYLGLPPDFSKLLVVRPTDIELGRDKESDKLMLRRFLSHKEILDQIEDNIEQESVKTCQVNGYTISGDSRGKIKQHEQLQKKLNKIDTLFNQVEEKYFGGELFQLKEKKQKLDQELEKLNQAKRYQAFKLDKKKQELEQKINKINEPIIDQLTTEYNGLKRDEANIAGLEKELKDLKQETKHYPWLTKAIEIYQEFNLQSLPAQPRILLLGGLIAGFLLTGTFFMVGLQLAGIVSLIVLAISVVYLILVQNHYLKEFGRREELNKLKQGFETFFNRKLNNLADLKAEQEKLSKKFHTKEVLSEKIRENKRKLNSDKAVLVSKVTNLLNQDISFDEIQTVLDQEKQKKRDLETALNKKNQQSAVLGVKLKDFLDQPQEIDYDRSREEQLSQKLDQVKQEINQKESELDSLKHQILNEVDAGGPLEIKDLIEPLAEKRDQVLSDYKEITAEIIAKKNVFELIKKLYQAEDEKIDRVLNSSLIKQLLPQITTRYDEIYLDGQTLMVKDDYDSFPVSELSSGAKEQVFLALRIGLASEWFKNNKMFLILDDAFIHSDRHRKPELVKKVIELGQSGWQIICFSFDDRIKKLFAAADPDYNLLNLNKL